MGLFNKFTDTEFYKSDSELEQQLEALKKLNSEYPGNEQIEQKLKICEMGLLGEKQIEFELKNANIGMCVLHDVNLQYEDLKAQVDYIVITAACVYFLECKNLIGNITINDRGEFIREYSYGGRKIKEGFYSPVTQAERHVDVFKKIWKTRNTGLISKLQYNNMDKWYKPLVVMANQKSLLKMSYAPKNVKSKVIRLDNLIKYLKYDLEHTEKDLLYKEKAMREMSASILINYNKRQFHDYYEEFKQKYIAENDTPKSQESDFKAMDKDEKLKNKLIEFRTARASQMRYPPYYIFTNDELDKLVKTKPTTIEELRTSKVLTEVKVKTHGEEIVKVINEES